MSEATPRAEEQTTVPGERTIHPAERENVVAKPVHTGRHARVRQRLGRRR